jgi:flavin-dependent dehydrogenase
MHGKSSVKDVDLVIVGGGFAGLVMARTAALRGLATVVLERRSQPGARVHTTGLLVKEAADALDVPARLTRKIRGVRLYTPSLAATDLEAAGYWFLATDTPGLLEWLAAEAARAGVLLRHACPFHGAERDGARIRITGTPFRARYLVGADGAHSRVARCFQLERNRRFLVGIEAEFAGGDRVPADRLHCFVNRALAPGYIAWAVPGVGVTQVGLARSWPGRPDLQRFLRLLAPVAELRGERPVGWRAGTIPVGGVLSRVSVPGVLLVGDAAGWVSPLTGGGIANAFLHGRRAAQRVCEHLCDDGPDPGTVLARELPGYGFKKVLRAAMSIGIPDPASEHLLASSLGRALARQLFFHCRGEPRGVRGGDPRGSGAQAA